MKQSKIKNIACVVMMLYSITSCKRQELEEPQSYDAVIPITVDWSSSGISEQSITNLSVYIYPKDGSTPYIKISSNIDSTSVTLPVGEYSVLVFNDAIGNLEGINFKQSDEYSLFTAGAIEDTATDDIYYSLGDSQMLVYSHEPLAAWRMDDFVVSSDMVYNPCCNLSANCTLGVSTIEELMDISPTPVTATTTVTLSIDNLDNAMTIQGVITGFAAGAYLSTNERTSSTLTNVYSFTFQTRDYDDSSEATDGTTEVSFYCFGKNLESNTTYELTLDIILNSGERVSVTKDITSQVEQSDDYNIVVDLTQESDVISLPENAGTGFGVESWGDSEHVELL
ncbi:MAG: DUF5119 domain-containing protein [Rikenellaceae bacterium]